MTTQPEIAIIEPNTLSSLGLKSILEEIIPMATIRTFHRFNELMDDTPDMYAHYFISAQIYVEHNKEIADKLNISLTTVITHRKNITEKLGIKSVSGLTIYAVMNGYIEADRI